MNWRKVIIGILATLYFFMLAGAIGTHLLLHRAPLDGVGSASFLFLAGGLVFFAAPGTERARMLVIGILGYISEVVGVKYGWLYGRYIYTEVLEPNVFEVPVVMVCAWFILTSYVKQLLTGLALAGWLEVLVGSLWMTVIDLLLDPLAAHPFNFWNWAESGGYYGIPAQNFLGWLVVSGVIFTVDKLVFRAPWTRSSWQQIVGLGIIVLYTSCAFGYGYLMAGVVGLLLLGGQFVISAFPKITGQPAMAINTTPPAN